MSSFLEKEKENTGTTGKNISLVEQEIVEIDNIMVLTEQPSAVTISNIVSLEEQQNATIEEDTGTTGNSISLAEHEIMEISNIMALTEQQSAGTISSSASLEEQQNATIEDSASACCIPCTAPKDTCCLRCADVSSPREHDLLMAMMEGLTHHIMAKHSSSHDWLKTRAWEGNSHIGNRPEQGTYYYDWARSVSVNGDDVKHVCEIGMNGGHSALIFLATLSVWKDSNNASSSSAKLTMFDLYEFSYSETVEKYIEMLYPGRFVLYKGPSGETVPEWIIENKSDKCDIFSVDGDHSYDGAKNDIMNAARATKKGGWIILDDMNPEGDTRRAFESVLAEGILVNKRCVEDVIVKVGYKDRYDETNARFLSMAWCTAMVP